MNSNTMSIAIPIQNGQRTHSQDQEAIGWTDNSFKMTKTIPMTVRQPRPLDAADFVDIHFSFKDLTLMLATAKDRVLLSSILGVDSLIISKNLEHVNF